MKIFSSKRSICSMILSIFVVSMLFTGCKGGDADALSSADVSGAVTSLENTEVVEQYKDKEHELLPESMDLGGFELVIATPDTKRIVPEEGATVEGDLKLEKLREVQEKYNCVITLLDTSGGNSVWDEAMTSIVSGDEYANVLLPCVHEAGGFLQAKLCADFLQKDIAQYIDMSKPWWNDTMAYASNILGSVYAGATAIQNPAGYTWVTYFNKRVASEIGLGENDLYDLYDKGEWNWDNYVKYAKLAVKDQDGSGSMDSLDDRWGLGAPGYDCIQAFTSSAKVASVTTDNGMNPKYSFNTTHAITTLTRLNQLFTTDGIYSTISWNNGHTLFAAGNSLFFNYMLSFMGSDELRSMEDDWGLLPMPKGPKEGGGWQDKYMSRVDHNFRLCLIPATVEDKASTALVLEALSYKYFQIINDEIDVMATAYCRDDKSVEIAASIYDTSSFEISQFMVSIAGYNSVESRLNKVVSEANYDISGEMNSCADIAQGIIDDYFNGL